jgi:hypothetical protein
MIITDLYSPFVAFLVYLLPKCLALFSIQIFLLWAYLMNVFFFRSASCTLNEIYFFISPARRTKFFEHKALIYIMFLDMLFICTTCGRLTLLDIPTFRLWTYLMKFILIQKRSVKMMFTKLISMLFHRSFIS